MGRSPISVYRTPGSFRSTAGHDHDIRPALCVDWPEDEVETGLNPYRPRSRPLSSEWVDLWASLPLSTRLAHLAPQVQPDPTDVLAEFIVDS